MIVSLSSRWQVLDYKAVGEQAGYSLIVGYVLELVGGGGGEGGEQRQRAERRHAESAAHSPHDTHTTTDAHLSLTWNNTTLSRQWAPGATGHESPAASVSSGPSRAAGPQGEHRVASARRAPPPLPAPPAAPHRPAAALTLRANHTPNNAAAYYLLLRFICSYIGLMVSDRCERLRPVGRQHPVRRALRRAARVGPAAGSAWWSACWCSPAAPAPRARRWW